MHLRLLARRINETSARTLPLVRPEDIESETGSLVAENYSSLIVVKGDKSLSLACANDILICQLRPYLAKVVLAEQDVHASSELIVLRARESVDPKWLHLLLLSQQLTSYATRFSEGSKMPRTSWEKLANFEVANLPSLDAQKTFVSEVDSKLVGIRRSIQLTKQLETSLVESRRRILETGFAEILDGTTSHA